MDEHDNHRPPETTPAKAPDNNPGAGAGHDKPSSIEPSMFGRWGRTAIVAGTAVAAVAIVALAGSWLYMESKTGRAMDVLAMSSRTPPPAAAPQPPPVPTAPAATMAPVASSPVPPLVLLEPQPKKAEAAQATKADPAPKAEPAPKKVASAPAKPAAKSKRQADTAVARAPEKRQDAATARRMPASDPLERGVTIAPRCNKGDLARECLADLCRLGKKPASECAGVNDAGFRQSRTARSD